MSTVHYYTALQNEFRSLGFPRQGGVRNIAIVNGNENGGRQAPANEFDPGDLLIEGGWGLTERVKIRTNALNGRTDVLSLRSSFPLITTDRSYTFDAFNYDITAGGADFTLDEGSLSLGWAAMFNLYEIIDGSTATAAGEGNFSFVPLFSSVAYTGPRSSQADIERSVANMQANNWIPFDAVYSDSRNTGHVRSGQIQGEWNDLFRNELGLTINFACQVPAGTAAPPAPVINGAQHFGCPYQNLSFRVDNASVITGLYAHRWKVTGEGTTTTGTGETLPFSRSTPGLYTLAVTRTYGGGSVSSDSRTVRIYPSSDPNYCGGSGGGGGGAIKKIG